MGLKQRNSQRAVYIMLMPYLLGTLLLVIIPTLIAIGLAFTTYDGFSAPTWTGFDNFAFIGQYNAFLYAVRNTVGFIILAVPLRLLAMLGLALLLRARRRGGNLYR